MIDHLAPAAVSRRALGLGLLAAATVAGPALAPAAAQAPPPGSANDPRPRTYPLLGQPAPSFDLPRLGGGQARLADFRGKPTVLYFWGLWCPDCVADGAHVNRLARGVAADPRLAMLAIHTRGRFGRYGSVPAYFQQTGYSYPTAFENGRTWAGEVYRIGWYPTFLVLDKTGVIRHFRTDLAGPAGADAVLAQLRALA